nr:immunoglobulin heavy chain junction region [Mus musculus]MBK4184416.1 immunoglobulin heavy chain junction region [Mus musculus]MBK4184417.1 immunoglobulin heavy chain junction region [Mus musculus]MBK4184418.1 immunoglobulin heavy chain junction region [Mus musculus]MBK4184419.1 immunoglobulin heavy chain junction region [Mus musculus]
CARSPIYDGRGMDYW